MNDKTRIRLYAWGLIRENQKIPKAFQVLYRKYTKKYNFGDFLSYYLISSLYEGQIELVGSQQCGKLLAIGTVLSHALQDHDIVWGSGLNSENSTLVRQGCKVIAVRGPLTYNVLMKNKIIEKKDKVLFFDPAILLQIIHPKFLNLTKSKKKYDTLLIPHYSELEPVLDLFYSKKLPKDVKVLSPYLHPLTLARKIAKSRQVISSSLHGLIVAESLGIKAVPFKTSANSEGRFKYEDYYEGTGRIAPKFSDSVKKALDACSPTSLVISKETLLTYTKSFPFTLKSKYNS